MVVYCCCCFYLRWHNHPSPDSSNQARFPPFNKKGRRRTRRCRGTHLGSPRKVRASAPEAERAGTPCRGFSTGLSERRGVAAERSRQAPRADGTGAQQLSAWQPCPIYMPFASACSYLVDLCWFGEKVYVAACSAFLKSRFRCPPLV